ncbi:MAG: aldehyde ferredoxin oxidoreductase family protein [Candidatus Methanomethylicia archaeon]
MFGWNGKILRINLSLSKVSIQKFNSDLALSFLGGRGFAIKILWDELPSGIDPLSPENKLILATGPLTGLPIPSSGKIVVASKSPLTGGYGDGNLGSVAATELRKAGYDAIVIEGKAEKPCYINIEDDFTEVVNADDLWGLTTFECERKLKQKHGKNVGVLTIGPAGENLVKYANILSQEGRAGGRPGIGAVMGSKKLKAIVIRGNKDIPVANVDDLKRLGADGYANIKSREGYDFWRRQGTMMTIEWSQENSVLPTYNFREGVFDYAKNIDGYTMEKIKISQRGCPYCNMICGNVVRDSEDRYVELDYENVAMLGSNIGVGDLNLVSTLNRLADEYGVDTISVGNVIGFAMEASERKLISERIEWGDYKAARELMIKIVNREDIGEILAEGVRKASEKIGGGSYEWAMHVKGLEISAYNCHTAIAMALAYATSPIGAHHKDSWVISWEVKTDRFGVNRGKAEKVIELQRIRGGVFESLTLCRFPWIELGFELEWYLKYLKAATGVALTMDELYVIADRIYNLIRAFWIREMGGWSREMDWPPQRWFNNPLTRGPFKGEKLDRSAYSKLLSWYYELRGWDENGIPRKATLKQLGLDYTIEKLEKTVNLTP